jgi:HAD superfamily hydrolase (TIGR01509 family)
MALKAIFFDQDGVIIDTERDGHRVAFNQAFREFGFQFQWDVEEYHALLQVGGGKERMKHYLRTRGFGVAVAPEAEEDLIRRLHLRKTAIFIELLESGRLPLRPGVKRLMKEAAGEGLKLGICTTSDEKAAHAIASGMLKDIPFRFVLAGDVVRKKKPDPEIYLLALQKTGLAPSECLVVEDSANGIRAAKAAGIPVLATSNPYTEREDLTEADIVVTCLGDSEGAKGILRQGGDGLDYNGILTLKQLLDWHRTLLAARRETCPEPERGHSCPQQQSLGEQARE